MKNLLIFDFSCLSLAISFQTLYNDFIEITASMVILERISNMPYQVRYDHAPIAGIANEAKSISREWINEAGNDIMPELYDYLKPLIQGEITVSYKDGIPVYMPVTHLKPRA